MIKKLYHGTKVYFDYPDLNKAKNFKDFGKGFYLTSNREQAMRWAVRSLKNNDSKCVAYVYEYEFDMISTKKINILELLKYNREWLDFIALNRCEGENEIYYDLIYDRMADNTGDILTENIKLYWLKKKSAIEVLNLIKFKNRSADQYCFKTEKALSCLKRKSCIVVRKVRGNPQIKSI